MLTAPYTNADMLMYYEQQQQQQQRNSNPLDYGGGNYESGYYD